MLRKKDKAFRGSIGGGLPYEDFESALESPDSVADNLENLRPMIRAIRDMAATTGWTKYIQPFLEKKQSPAKLLELIEKGQDARAEAAQIKAFGSLLNLVGSMVRTSDSLDRIAAGRAAKEAAKEADREIEDAL